MIRDALKSIRELAQVASESEDIELVQKHIAMIKEIAVKTLKGDSFQTQVFPQPPRVKRTHG